MIPALPDEASTLRAMLGYEAEPVYLDMKPVELLTAGERKKLKERLAEVELDDWGTI
jgi:hypothetical protein